MKKLESFDEYKNIIKDYRLICKRPFSNVYYMPNDIKRYIELGRVDYERSESGIIFLFDEETYYRACLYVNERDKFVISPQKKRVLIKNVYQKGKKEEKLLCTESRLTELGFKKVGTSVAIQGDSQKLVQRCKHMEKYAEAMEKKGYRCIEADFSLFNEMEAIIVDSGIIKDYQLNYRTDEEKKNLERGSYLCMMKDEHQICAVSACIIEHGIGKGVAMTVKEKYKMRGLAPILTYYRFKWLCDHDINFIHAWILTDNEPSLRYHQSLGFEFLNEYADEWILDKEK